jgi:hypothetical protein
MRPQSSSSQARFSEDRTKSSFFLVTANEEPFWHFTIQSGIQSLALLNSGLLKSQVVRTHHLHFMILFPKERGCRCEGRVNGRHKRRQTREADLVYFPSGREAAALIDVDRETIKNSIAAGFVARVMSKQGFILMVDIGDWVLGSAIAAGFIPRIVGKQGFALTVNIKVWIMRSVVAAGFVARIVSNQFAGN